jgi:hypothetical protein
LSQVLNNNKHVEEFLFKTPLVDIFHTRKKHSHLALKKLKVSSKLTGSTKKEKEFFSQQKSLSRLRSCVKLRMVALHAYIVFNF